jgi:AraC-like DNA-binding protein
MPGKCNHHTGCDFCKESQKDVFMYRQYARGVFIPRIANPQNAIYFLLRGEVWVNSSEYPDTIVRDGAFILQPAGSAVEFRIHTPSEGVVYLFDRLPTLCEHFRNFLHHSPEEHIPAPVMQACEPVRSFLEGIKRTLNDELYCNGYMQSKQVELFYLLNYYYTRQELTCFYAPVHHRNQSFRYFVMNNYHRIKDLEDFARLGDYKIHTFRQLFKETFNEPAYQWILKQKRRDIYIDLTTTDMSITEISRKYGFETLSNFSHFCTANFGKSPRALRNK